MELKAQIQQHLLAFSETDLWAASISLLSTLGYRSDKTLDLDNTPNAVLAEFDKRDRKLRKDKALFERWKSVEFLFQITDDEVKSAGGQGRQDFDSGYDSGNYQSYLFFALDLEKNRYTRTQLADITREINLLFDMPAMLLMRYNGALTFSIIDRRLHKKDQNRDVLEKVKLIKDIRYQQPHRAHIEILHDLSLQTLMAKHECRDFKQLHEAWRTTLDTNELNKKFFRELADWYFWALDYVEFPADIEKDAATRNATSVIRLLTRFIFCWFLKEKGLIPDDLFRESKISRVLKSLDDDDTTFYLAILQNLFFGTLNQRMNSDGQENRRFANDGSFLEQRKEYGVKNLYRYQKLFAIAEEEAVKLFSDIPFLNGGLFDCLDKEDDSGKVIYVDGFTRNVRKQPKVPNFLFFSDYRTFDLSDAYGDKKRKKEKVRGLINLLDSYKFTIAENTPIEEEIALDPELLGKVFENLLASYNPETGTTARKQTGSFYTPREIVNYMVDESLIAYLEGQLKAKVPKLLEMKDFQNLLREVFAYTEKVHPFDEEEVEALIGAIDTCKILDPACGSGAFPMGILHKLVFILGKLDPHNERWKQKQLDKLDSVSMREELERTFENNDDDYGRKLCLIENSIYGVDIQPIAIQISKLRFFISLICNQRTNKNNAQNRGVHPLPNLETKFVAANTLISLDRGQDQKILTDDRLPRLEEELTKIRHKHFAAQRRRDKLALQKRDAELREEIATVLADGGMSSDASLQLAACDLYDQNTFAPFFDTEWMYGITDGFDVVIGNPPYVQIQKFPKAQKEKWVAQNYQTYAATADIYCLFYERGAQLLKIGGHLCYITSNNWMRANYGSKLRQFLSTEVDPIAVLDFGMGLNFSAAAALTNTLLFTRQKNSRRTRCCYAADSQAAMADPGSYFSKNAVYMPELAESSWVVVTPERYRIKKAVEVQGVPLEEWDLNINYGIKTGLNEAFYLTQEQRNELIAKEAQAEEIIVPLLRGRYVERYRHSWDGTWMLGTFPTYGIEIENYPFLRKHLSLYRERLEPKPKTFKGNKWPGRKAGSYKWFETQDSIGYHREFLKPKIIYPNMTKYLPFYYDQQGYFFLNDKAFIMTSESESLLYLTAVLNSSLFRCCFRDNFPELLGNTYEVRKVFMDKIPIKKSDVTTVTLLETLVYYIQFAKGCTNQTTSNGTSPAVIAAFLEELIDACVMEIYFADHMVEQRLSVIAEVRNAFKPLLKTATDSARWQQLQSFYKTVNAPKHPIRNRLMRIPIDSPDLLRVIKEEGRV